MDDPCPDMAETENAYGKTRMLWKKLQTLEDHVNLSSVGWCSCKNMSGFGEGLEIAACMGYFGQVLFAYLPFLLILETQNNLGLKRP